MTRRNEKISALLLRSIQQVVARGLSDPRVRGLITVTDVTVSPDLAEARVLVSVLPESSQDLTLHGLQAAATHLRREVGELVDLRRMPQLIFRADRRLKTEASILDALNKVAQERQEHGGQHPGWSGGESTRGQQSDSGAQPPPPEPGTQKGPHA